MKTLKTILMVALVSAALVAIPASAQTSKSEGGDGTVSALMAMIDNQQVVIELQQNHIDSLEAFIVTQQTLIRSQQALLDADLSHLAPAVEPARKLTDAEMADAAVLCAPWKAELETTEFRRSRWVVFAAALEDGIVTDDTLQATIPGITSDRDRLTVAIPQLVVDHVIEAMTGMEEAIDAIIKAITANESAESLIAKINTALERFDELEIVLVDLCGGD